MDVKIALLNGELEEEISRNNQKGYIIEKKKKRTTYVDFIRSLYGLKQVPKQ